MTPDLEEIRATAAPDRLHWLRSHAAGLVAFLIGLTALAITAAVHLASGPGFTEAFAKIPDTRLTIPLLILTVIAAVATLVRREGAYALPVAGLALAASATVLGWALLIGTVVAVTALIIVILSEFM